MSRRLGRYELRRRLGKGGGGEVWEAVLHGPAGFRRRVAVKLLHADAGRAATDDLVHEARLGALVAHPNVVSTFELGQADGQWFLVMDLVDGCSVHQLVRRAPLSASALLEIGVQVCAGLAHIHDLRDPDGWPLGLVHRDIKPGNLMIDTTHRVRIVDLGIAKLQGTAQVPSGTPGYVAPEQLDGKETATADLFALGVTLTRLATGRWPFGRGRAGLAGVMAHDADARATDPELRAALDATVPGLGDVLCRAMRASPERRWARAEDMGEALRHLFAACADAPPLATRAIPSNAAPGEGAGGMTTERGSFVGRREEQAAVDALLQGERRWSVLVGPGGVGKTRLLDEVVRDRPHVRVDASQVRSVAGACVAVATALGVSVERDPVAGVGRALEEVSLLVLDEIEHGVDAVTEVVAAWLAARPELRVICSSRVAPGHPDAVLVRIGPLSLRDAHRLFAERLGRAVPEHEVAPMLRALDRLPLAVELAAARARRTSPAQVARQLQAMSAARVPGVREALEASWALLDADDRIGLVRLAAWEGPFGAQDAASVLPPDGAPMTRIDRLIDHSMLHVRGNRFRLLTSVRAFAREQLPAERIAGEQRHGRWLSRLGETTTVDRLIRSWERARTVLPQLDDLVVASRRARARDDGEVAVATALAACAVFSRVGLPSAMVELVDDVLPTGVRVHELHHTRAAGLHVIGRIDEAMADIERARDLAHGADRWHLESVLARIHVANGDHDAIETVERAVAALDAYGPSVKTTAARTSLGTACYLVGRLSDAEHHLSRSLREQRLAHRDTGHVLGLLAWVRVDRGQFGGALRDLDDAVAALDAQRDDTLGLMWRVHRAELLWDAGATRAASDQARWCVEESEAQDYVFGLANALAVLSWAAGTEGRWDEALTLAHRAVRVSEGTMHSWRVGPLLAQAEALLATGDAPQGLASLAEAEGLAHAQRRASTRLFLLQARYGPPQDALRAIEDFWAPLTAEQHTLRAATALARGEAEHRAGRPKEARGALLQASQALAETDLPPAAPLQRALTRIRGAILAT